MMGNELDTLSSWFVLNAGFKVYGRCPVCFSHRIAYHKERKTGLKGISSQSKGFTPACMDCGKSLLIKKSQEVKVISKIPNKKRKTFF